MFPGTVWRAKLLVQMRTNSDDKTVQLNGNRRSNNSHARTTHNPHRPIHRPYHGQHPQDTQDMSVLF